ncbi:MAG: HEAT repeat domain-containing protein [Planctomycetia bacterium]
MKLIPVIVLVVATAPGVAGAAADDPEPRKRESHQEWMAALGYQRHGGSWRTAQEIAIIERNARTNVAQKEWNKKIERLRRDVAGGNDSDRAAEELQEIADPHAVPAITAALAAEPNRRVRLLYLNALTRIRDPSARMALVAAAVDHPNPETRIDAAEKLAELAPREAANAISAALAGPDNGRINRAAAALERIGVPTVVPALIASLETRHVVTVGDGPPEGSTTATFTPEGGGLSLGSSRKQVAVPFKNEQVLEALVSLSGKNFGWDVAAWRAWLARQRAPATIDLRRG